MLHILWTILKVILSGIGIVLLVILGIILIALLLVLFCPVRYRVHAEKQKEEVVSTARAEGRVSWLFGGIAVSFRFSRSSRQTDIRLFGIPLQKILGFFRKKKGTSVKTAKSGGKKKDPVGNSPETDQNSSGPASSGLTDKPSVNEHASSADEDKRSVHTEKRSVHAKKSSVHAEKPSVPVNRPSGNEVQKKSKGLRYKIRTKAAAFRKAVRKAMRTRDFLFHSKTQAALRLVLEKARGLIRHAMPVYISGQMEFGLDDPSLTGRILAFLGATVPFHKNRVEIIPHFECENVIGGHVDLRGRIYGIVAAAAAVRILLDKNVHFVIRSRKHKEAA